MQTNQQEQSKGLPIEQSKGLPTEQSKQFRRWSDLEEQQLLNEVSEGMAVYAIAKVHDRSKKAIELRLLDISIRMINNGITYEEVFDKTKCTEEQVKLRQLQLDDEKVIKTSKKSDQIPFRQIEALDTPTINTILAELRELKTMLANIMTN